MLEAKDSLVTKKSYVLFKFDNKGPFATYEGCHLSGDTMDVVARASSILSITSAD